MKNFSLRLVLIFMVLFLVGTCPVLAQQSFEGDLSKVRVQELSDTQLKQMLREAEVSGLSDQQITNAAEQRGLPPNELAELKKRIMALRNVARGGDFGSDQAADTIQTRRTLNYSTRRDSLSMSEDRVFSRIIPKVFGADIFNNDNLTFSPNLKLATPLNYVVGPEDQLNINIYGNSVANWKLEVSPDGNINLPVAGLLNVAGKTIEEVSRDIKAKLTAYRFAIGKGTSVTVSLGNIRSIKVMLIGNLQKPGTYTLPSLATAFNALYAAGGPNDRGTFRQIEIIRNNKIIKVLDVYDFLTRGDQKNNIALRDQDIIRVPTYKIHVEMAGEINNPAIYEVLPGETLQQIIDYAGGFTDHAYAEQIKVYQVSDRQRRITDVENKDFSTYKPRRGDRYVIEPVLDRFENRVVITGAVFRPGDYELSENLTLSQLISKAAGLKEDAVTERGSITRLNADNTKKLIPFDVQGVLSGSSADIALQREDSVYIASIFDLRDKYKVTINGSVRNPGDFAYADSMKVTDLIMKAGGLLEGGSTNRIEVAQRKKPGDGVLNKQNTAVYSVTLTDGFKLSEHDFTLRPYDIVSVYSLPDYEKQRTVKVEGEVQYPGYYTLRSPDEKISDLIKRAGNLKPTADANGSSLKRTNVAILGVDKSKVDSAAVQNERASRLRRLQRSYRDTSLVAEEQARNNYIGINLTQIIKKPGSVSDLRLEDGDVLRVPKQQQVVRVNGEVLYPSVVVFEKQKTFKDFINSAGGFSPRALKKGAYVVHANGAVEGTRKFLFFNNYPEVKSGSEIYVPQKPAPVAGSAQLAVALTTGLASLGAIILGILSLRK